MSVGKWFRVLVKRMLLLMWWCFALGVLYMAVRHPGVKPCSSQTLVWASMFWLSFPSSLIVAYAGSQIVPRLQSLDCGTHLAIFFWLCFTLAAYAQYKLVQRVKNWIGGRRKREQPASSEW